MGNDNSHPLHRSQSLENRNTVAYSGDVTIEIPDEAKSRSVRGSRRIFRSSDSCRISAVFTEGQLKELRSDVKRWKTLAEKFKKETERLESERTRMFSTFQRLHTDLSEARTSHHEAMERAAELKAENDRLQRMFHLYKEKKESEIQALCRRFGVAYNPRSELPRTFGSHSRMSVSGRKSDSEDVSTPYSSKLSLDPPMSPTPVMDSVFHSPRPIPTVLIRFEPKIKALEKIFLELLETRRTEAESSLKFHTHILDVGDNQNLPVSLNSDEFVLVVVGDPGEELLVSEYQRCIRSLYLSSASKAVLGVFCVDVSGGLSPFWDEVKQNRKTRMVQRSSDETEWLDSIVFEVINFLKSNYSTVGGIPPTSGCSADGRLSSASTSTSKSGSPTKASLEKFIRGLAVEYQEGSSEDASQVAASLTRLAALFCEQGLHYKAGPLIKRAWTISQENKHVPTQITERTKKVYIKYLIDTGEVSEAARVASGVRVEAPVPLQLSSPPRGKRRLKHTL